MPPTKGARPVAAAVLSFSDGAPRQVERLVPEEVPVEVAYGTVPFAVMMMTPTELDDFAAGFSLTEGIISSIDDIRAISVDHGGSGYCLSIDLAPTAFHAHLARRRSLSGRTSCGVCGVETLDDLPYTPPRPDNAAHIPIPAVRRALNELESHQALNRETGAVHAACFAALDGRILLVREDVGRHNALDKLIGAALRANVAPASGFVLVTSRASFEMVEKVASFGSHALVAISMPTSLAIDRARLHGITLVGVARRDTMTVFHGAERFEAELIEA